MLNIIVIRVNNVFRVIFFARWKKLSNWLNRRDRSEESFNDKGLLLVIYVSLLFVKQSSGEELAKEKKLLYVTVPNGKILSRHEMQYQGSLDL